VACLQVLRLVFSCLKNAPASYTWDLSSLLVNGSPVRQTTVIAVFEVLYSNIWALGFEADRSDGQYSLRELLDMLLFADAVGCSKQALNQLAGLLGSAVTAALELPLTAAAASSVNGAASNSSVLLQLDGWFRLQDNWTDIAQEAPPQKVLQWHTASGVFAKATEQLFNPQQVVQLQQQLSQQLDSLLCVGFKLDLQQLLQPALRFLRTNSDSLQLLPQTGDRYTAIFLQRVLAAAGGGAKASDLLSRALLQQRLGRGFGVDSVLKDVNFNIPSSSYSSGQDCIFFQATLMQQMLCFDKGARVVVRFSREGNMTWTQRHASTGATTVPAQYPFGIVLGPACTFSG
jgi:hypothetical protein